MKFTKAKNLQTYTEILEQVCDAIMRGELRKGDWLPSERQIAADTGISRTNVREAIRALNEAKMVRISPGRSGGTQLISITLPVYMLGTPIENKRQRLLEFYETRNIIESSAALLSAERASPAQIEELEQTLHEMEQLVENNPGDYGSYLAIDAHFHRMVVQCSQNRVLFDTYLPILRKIMLVNDMVEVLEMHPYGLPSMRQFVQAVKDRNPQSAQAAIEAHVKPLINFILRKYPEDSED